MSRVKRVNAETFIKRSIRIDEESYKFIRKHYTGTSFEWLINELLAAYIEQHSKVHVPDLVELAATEVFANVQEIISSDEDIEEESP